jgi:purine catabolism regulator
MITVQEILKNVLPPQTEILAGQDSLSREVNWVVASRTRTPIFDNLKGGEMVLISMRSLRLLDEELDLPRFFGYLIEMGVAGAVVLGEIGEMAVEAAEELGLPLLALPEGTHMGELERAISKYIVDNRQQLQQWNQEVYRQFTELAIEGRGLNAIAERLCELTSKAVIIEDNNFRLRARYAPENFEQQVATVPSNTRSRTALLSSPANNSSNNAASAQAAEGLNSALREHASALRDWLNNRELKASDPPLHSFELDGGLLQLIAPIIAQGSVSGYVSLVGREFNMSHRVALSRAASACAIERAREIAVSAVEDRFQANVLDELLDGNFTNPEAVIERARRLGYNLSLPYYVAAFAFRNQENRSRKKPLTIVLDGRKLELDLPISENMARELQRLVEQEASRRQMTTITRVRDDRFVLLFSPGRQFASPIDVKKAAKIFQDRFSAQWNDISVTVGVGRYYEGVEGLSKAAIEAEKAVTMGLRLFGPGQLTYFGDLGVYRLLLSIGQQKELREFYQEVLGQLIDHDSRNGGELLQTLEAYFQYHGSPSKMAEGMHLHRNTLLYRLRRIQDITNLDLEDAETRLALHMALRIGEVLGERR